MSNVLRAELDALRSPDGKLIVENVHEWARTHPDSELHKRLEWDDVRAGYQWRLQQIRQLIIVTMVDRTGDRTMISLRVDRNAPGGGYRRLEDVAKVRSLTDHMLDDATRDLSHWVHRYDRLREVAGESTERLFDTVLRWIHEQETRDRAA